MMKKVRRLVYAVRLGPEKGKGAYARAKGCMCSGCIKWVDDADDATWFASKGWPLRIAARDGGRVVRKKGHRT